MGLFGKNKKQSKGGLFRADANHTKILIEVGKSSAERSINETKALGLPITYLEGNNIIREHVDGTKEIIGNI